jgi:hypothetical protein
MGEPANVKPNPLRHPGTAAGLALITIGAAALSDQYLRTGWLGYISIPLIGLIFLAAGYLYKSWSYLITGCLLSGLGAGVFFILNTLLTTPILHRIGLLLACFGAGWVLITLVSHVVFSRTAWWPLVPGGIISSVGACFIFSNLTVVEFFFYSLTGLSLALIMWGCSCRIFGLIIPACILLGVGLGLYLAWGHPGETSPLAQTGIMLSWFALGWGLITLLGRAIFNKFIWWPIIPGGVLAMVGLGLYLGGNPDNAVGFLRNTGSIGLLIFGLYLLLMRRGIRS